MSITNAMVGLRTNVYCTLLKEGDVGARTCAHPNGSSFTVADEVQRLQARLVELESSLRRERDRAELYEKELQRLRAAAATDSSLRPSGAADTSCVCCACCAAAGGGQGGGRAKHGREVVVISRREYEMLLLKERAMDTVKEGITIADFSQPDMPIVYANVAFSRLTGYSVEFTLGRNCRFLQGQGTDPATVQELRAAVRGGRPCVVQLLNYKRNGDPFMNYLSLTPVHNASGVLTHYVGVQSDITELVRCKNSELAAKHAAAEAAAATEAKSQFLARMSHEIRTPLNGMIAVGELLAETCLSPAQWDLVNTIRCSGETLLMLITDILDFSKIEANKLVLSAADYRLQTVVEAAMEIAGLKAAQKRLNVAYHISDNVPRVLVGDAQRLQQVLLNIVNNAVKFTEEGEILLEVWATDPADAPPPADAVPGAGPAPDVGCLPEADSPGLAGSSGSHSGHSVPGGSGAAGSSESHSGHSVPGGSGAAGSSGHAADRMPLTLQFCVTDTGIGISAADQACLFQSFSQVDASPTRRHGGSGLGLAISRKLCEAMGGTMWVSSPGLGGGSKFQWTIRTHAPRPLLSKDPAGGAAAADGGCSTTTAVGGSNALPPRHSDGRGGTGALPCSSDSLRNGDGAAPAGQGWCGGSRRLAAARCGGEAGVSGRAFGAFDARQERREERREERRDAATLQLLKGRKILVVEPNAMVRHVLTRALAGWGCLVCAVCCESDAIGRLQSRPGAPPLAPPPAAACSGGGGGSGCCASGGVLQLQHAAPLREEACGCGGPFDVVLADCDASRLVQALLHAGDGEAQRCVFMGWPGGQPTPDAAAALELGREHHQLVAPVAPPTPPKLLLQQAAGMGRRQLGYVAVTRPLRQGRLKLALEEVLAMDLSTAAALAPGSDTASEGSPGAAAAGRPALRMANNMVRCSSSSSDLVAKGQLPELRIMLAEDNMINMKVACGILSRMGYSGVTCATDGVHALEQLERAGGADAFDLILMDLHMPRKGGMEVVAELRERWPAARTCVIAVTADAFEDTRDCCLASGFDGWLPKPFRVDDMVRVVGQCSALNAQRGSDSSKSSAKGNSIC